MTYYLTSHMDEISIYMYMYNYVIIEVIKGLLHVTHVHMVCYVIKVVVYSRKEIC